MMDDLTSKRIFIGSIQFYWTISQQRRANPIDIGISITEPLMYLRFQRIV